MDLKLLREGSKAVIFTSEDGSRLLAINSLVLLGITFDNWLQVHALGTAKINDDVRYFMENVLHSYYSLAEQSFKDNILINIDTGEVEELE